MLLVGVWRYGYSNWEKIKNDPSLGLSDKLGVGSNIKSNLPTVLF
jgi:chromodomain-helicase-DNA-binding protein 1